MANDKAQAEKEKGNAAFKAGDYPNAIGHYTAAILTDRNDFTFPLNRAAAYLKLGKNEDAERDCTTVLTLSALNPKALFRRGQARLGLGKLEEAMQDLKHAAKREPSNESVKSELKKVADLLEQKKAKDLKKSVAKSVAEPSAPSPKRRRVPIAIVDAQPGASTSTPPSSKPQPKTRVETLPEPIPSSEPRLSADSGSLKAISTRSLKPAESSPAPLEPPAVAPRTPLRTPSPPPPEPSSNEAQKEADPLRTFKDAKRARETVKPSRVGGGIFRKTGESTLFTPRESSPSAPLAGPVSTPASASANVLAPTAAATATAVGTDLTPIGTTPAQPAILKTPMTLFDFTRTWDMLRTTPERWNLISTIPPSNFPAFFKISLEPVLLVSILTVFNEVLREGDSRSKVREYMDAFARVERFGTVVLFLSRAEKDVARKVWEALGVTKEDAGRLWRPVWA